MARTYLVKFQNHGPLEIPIWNGVVSKFKDWWLDVSARGKVTLALISKHDFCSIFPLRFYPTIIRENFYPTTIPNHTLFKVSRLPLALISKYVPDKIFPVRLYPTTFFEKKMSLALISNHQCDIFLESGTNRPGMDCEMESRKSWRRL